MRAINKDCKNIPTVSESLELLAYMYYHSNGYEAYGSPCMLHILCN
jgi:hypothetical protein